MKLVERLCATFCIVSTDTARPIHNMFPLHVPCEMHDFCSLVVLHLILRLRRLRQQTDDA